MRTFARSAVRLLLQIVVSVTVVVALWIAFLQVFAISPIVGKPPWEVWSYLAAGPDAAAHRGHLVGDLLVTLRDAAAGFAGGMAAASVLAVAFFLMRPLEQAFLPIAMLLRSVPLVAMTPLIIVVFGRELTGVAVIGAIVVFFPALVNLVFGLRSAPRHAVDLVSAYGGGKATLLRKVAVPAAVPAFFTATRIAVPASLIGALIAEWLATGRGTGGAILRAVGGFRYDELWATVVLLTATSVLLYTVVGLVEAGVLSRRFPDSVRSQR